MTERPDSHDPNIPRDPGPTFKDLTPADARELGLTNFDYLRYGRTGELPPDAQARLEQTRMAQLADANRLINPGAQRGQVAEVPQFGSSEAFLSWSHGTLEGLRAITAEPGHELSTAQADDIVSKAKSWHGATTGFKYELSVPDEADKVLDTAEHLGELRQVAKTTTARANILDAEGYLREPIPGASSELTQELNQEDLTVLAHLIYRKSPASKLAVRSLETRTERAATPQALADIVTTNFQPLIRRFKQVSGDMGLAAASEKFADFLAVTAEALATSPDAQKLAESAGYNRVATADALLDAFAQDQAVFGTGQLTHSDALIALFTLNRLYQPEDPQSPERSEQARLLMRQIYLGKIEPDPEDGFVPRIREEMSTLASKLHIDPSAIAP